MNDKKFWFRIHTTMCKPREYYECNVRVALIQHYIYQSSQGLRYDVNAVFMKEDINDLDWTRCEYPEEIKINFAPA